MKLLIIVLACALFFLTACGSDSARSSRAAVPEPSPVESPITLPDPTPGFSPVASPVVQPSPSPTPPVTPPVTPLPPPVVPPIILPGHEPPIEPDIDPAKYSLLIYNSSSAWLSNGVTHLPWAVGNILAVGPSIIAVDDLLYEVDVFGNTISITQLPAQPSAIALQGPDIWTFETVLPIYAASNGGLNREYTRAWLNMTEHGFWLDRQWAAVHALSTSSGDVIAYDTLNRRYMITSPETPHYAAQDGILIHSVDTGTKTASIRTDIGDYAISWSTNYMNGATKWLDIDNTWYSWNGYSWNNFKGLHEKVTSLTDFVNWTNPVVVAAGTRTVAFLDHGYWIEACTGWLWRYTPYTDSLTQATRLYVADGDRLKGLKYAAAMEPQVIGDILYYVFDDQVWGYDFVTGINNPFVANRSIRPLK